jgi:epoxyqueuosine reductase
MVQHKSGLDTELFQKDPCRFIETAIKKFILTSPLNHLTAFNNEPMVNEPIVAFANGDDRIFEDLKTIVGEFHLTPREIMEKYVAGKNWRSGPKKSIDTISVISWALPLTKETRFMERKSPYGGSPRYNHSRWIGVRLYEHLEQYVASLLEVLRINAVAPTRSKFFEIREMSGDWLAANWSERHVAYACGLGTFGLNGLIITSRGCAVYLGSVVCDQALTPTPRHPNPVANCPFYQDGSCGLCIEHCPGSAISKGGRSNIACLKTLRYEQAIKVRSLGLDRDLVGPAPSCGQCSTGVPCEDKIPPLASKKAKSS